MPAVINFVFVSPGILSIEMMAVKTVPDVFLFAVFARMEWRFEVSCFWCLEGRAVWAKGRINIVCLGTHRAVIRAINAFHLVTPGEGHPYGVPRPVLGKHAEP